MTPIINPWTIYLISRLDEIKILVVFAFLTVLLCIVGIALGQCFTVDTIEEWTEHMKKSCVKKLCIIFICIIVIDFFIPDTHTGFMILTAHYATEENINKGMEFIEKTTDHIVDKVKELEDN